MIKRLANFIDENLLPVMAVVTIFSLGIVFGFVVGLSLNELYTPEPESNLIIYDYPLTEEEVFERYEKYLNDQWYFTLEVDEYEISKEKVIEIIEEWLFEDTQPWDAEYRTPPEYW
jgi:hypothetical protein